MKNTDLPREVRLLHSFLNVNKNLAWLVSRTAVNNGLTVPQFSVLIMIAPHRKMTQKVIGEKTFMPKSTLSQAVDGLVKAELIQRRPVEGNRRELELTLSEKGEALIAELSQQDGSVAMLFKNACDTLSEKQYQDLLELHTLIVQTLQMEQGEQGKC